LKISHYTYDYYLITNKSYAMEKIRIGVILSTFNEFITKLLLEGAKKKFSEENVEYEVFEVPGSFEIPIVAKIIADKFDSILTLGCIIRGETYHFEGVVQGVVKGIVEAMLSKEKPVIFGILTVDNINQAIDRAGGKLGNKGYDFAGNAIYMAKLYKKLKSK